jgi:hypothetical protein
MIDTPRGRPHVHAPEGREKGHAVIVREPDGDFQTHRRPRERNTHGRFREASPGGVSPGGRRLHLLEQRSLPRYGHSEKFTPEDVSLAFEALVQRATRDHEDDDDDDRDRGPQAAVAPAPGSGERQSANGRLRR